MQELKVQSAVYDTFKICDVQWWGCTEMTNWEMHQVSDVVLTMYNHTE